MERLTGSQQRAALLFLRDAYAVRNFGDFVAFLLATFPALIRSEVTSYNEMWPRQGRSNDWSNPAFHLVPERRDAWKRVMHQQPLLNHYQQKGNSRVLRLSDFLSHRQLHNLALYNEHYRLIGPIEDVIPILWTGAEGAVNGIGLHRSNSFSDRERGLMEVLRPHLIQAHANSLALSKTEREASRLQRVLEASARALVVLKLDRTIEFATQSARRWLRDYFDASGSDRLPEPLDLWVRQHDSGVRQVLGLPKPRTPIVVNRRDRRLVVRLLSGHEEILLLLEEQTTAIEPTALRSLGLTGRESEVLAHMANGLRKVRIAQLLGTSLRTVDAHVQNILKSLGVSSSNAAIAKAFQASKLGSPNLPNNEDAALREQLIRLTAKVS